MPDACSLKWAELSGNLERTWQVVTCRIGAVLGQRSEAFQHEHEGFSSTSHHFRVSWMSLMNVDWCRQFARDLKTCKFSDNLLTDGSFWWKSAAAAPFIFGCRQTDRQTDGVPRIAVRAGRWRAYFAASARLFFFFWTNKGNCVISFSTVNAF